MLPPFAVDTRYTQTRITISALSVEPVEVAFNPDTWVLVPTAGIVAPVYYAIDATFDPVSIGIPIAGSSPTIIPTQGKSNKLYLYNSGASSVSFHVTASFGLPPPTISTPTTITEAGVVGVWQTLTDAATITWDLSGGSGEVTLGGNRTLADPTSVTAGNEYYLMVKQDATGSRKLDWGSAYKFEGGAEPRLSFLPNQVDLLEFVIDGDGNMNCQKITKNLTGEWTPLNLASLLIWLDADQITGLSDGDPVATWEDESGNGNDFTQVTASRRPLWRASWVNGHAAVQFDGVKHFLYRGLTINYPCQLFVVGSKDAGAGSGERRLYSGYNTWGIYAEYTTYHYFYFFNSGTIASSAINLDQFYLLCCKQTSGGGQFWLNGNSQGTNSLTLNPGTTQYVGAHGAALFHMGHIAEIIMTDVDLSNDDRQKVEAYLNSKYDLWS